MFLLIPGIRFWSSYSDLNLHSTMFLLILVCAHICFFIVKIYIPLCFYLYEAQVPQNTPYRPHLHSTMFLLIRFFWIIQVCLWGVLTFHYVSTYTLRKTHSRWLFLIYIPLCFYLYEETQITQSWVLDLHSTMFLLIRFTRYTRRLISSIYIPLCFYLYLVIRGRCRIRSNLHSTMFLLILLWSSTPWAQRINLHSTMFLLIRWSAVDVRRWSNIYIPLCFYLYFMYLQQSAETLKFTFHYVSTYTSLAAVQFPFLLHLHSTMFLLILNERLHILQ